MNITQEKIDSLNVLLKIKVNPDDYQSKVDASLKDYCKKAYIPGFRPGKVPVNMVRNKIGKSLMVEEINKIINESVHKYIVDNKIEIVGSPILNDEEVKLLDWDNQKDFEFMFELGLAPEIILPLDKQIELTFYNIKVEDENINEEIEKIKEHYGKQNPLDKVQNDKDIIYVSFRQLDEQNNLFEGGLSSKASITPGLIKDENIKKSFFGLKQNDNINIDVTKAFGDIQTALNIMNIKKDVIINITPTFKFTIVSIKQMEPATLNQELFDEIFGSDVVKSEEELKTNIKEDLIERFKNSSETVFYQNLQKSLLKNLNLSLPDEFLKKWLKTIKDKTTNIIDYYNFFAEELKWTLIENKIINQYNIQVSDDEIKQHVKDLYLQYNKKQNFSSDDLNAFANEYLKNQKSFDEIKKTLSKKKIIDFLKSKFNIKEKEVTLKEFNINTKS